MTTRLYHVIMKGRCFMMKFILMTSDPEHTKKLCETAKPEDEDVEIEYVIIDLNDDIDLTDMNALGEMINNVYTKCKESICSAKNCECVNVVVDSKIPAIMTLATCTIFADMMAGIDDDLRKFTAEHMVFTAIVINDSIVGID